MIDDEEVVGLEQKLGRPDEVPTIAKNMRRLEALHVAMEFNRGHNFDVRKLVEDTEIILEYLVTGAMPNSASPPRTHTFKKGG